MRWLTKLLVVLAACGGRIDAGATDDVGQEARVEIRYYVGGERTSVEVSAECRARIVRLVEELVGESDEELRLLVSEERIESIRGQEAAEVVWPEARAFEAGPGGRRTASRVLVPLAGDDFLGRTDRPFVTLFTGDSEGYTSGPLLNSTGLASAQAIRACLRSP